MQFSGKWTIKMVNNFLYRPEPKMPKDRNKFNSFAQETRIGISSKLYSYVIN